MLKSTGFFGGLFEDAELVSDNVKDRESKILFLTKVISVVGKFRFFLYGMDTKVIHISIYKIPIDFHIISLLVVDPEIVD